MKMFLITITLLASIHIISTLPRRQVRQIVDYGNTKINSPNQGCEKEWFVKNHLLPGKEKGVTLTEQAYRELSGCSDFAKQCNTWPGVLSTSVIDDLDGKVKILFEMYQLFKQDCWGYAVERSFYDKQKKTEIKETHYFNFADNKNDTDVSKLFQTKWGTRYNFTVTPLPTGKSLSVITTSPTKCQLPVMVEIYEKIIREEIFKECEKIPDYESRRKISEEICARQTPDMDAVAITKKLLVERNCKMILR